MDFKVGQTVEVINKCGMAASLGATAVVTKVMRQYYGMELIDVVWKTQSNNQINGGYQIYRFKPLIRKNEQMLFSFMINNEI